MANKAVPKVIEKRPSLHVVAPEIEALRSFQSHSNEVLDTKAGIVLGFSGTILAVLITAPLSDTALVPVAGVAFLSAAVVVGVTAMFARSYRYDPNPKELLEKYMLREPDAVTTGAREQILADKVKAYYENEPILARKARLVNAAALFLGCGLILISGHTLWRRIMSKDKPAADQSAPKPAESAPIAQPNPGAANTIKKGQGPSTIQK